MIVLLIYGGVAALLVALCVLFYIFAVASRKSYSCPQCGERMTTEHLDAKRCGMCGAELERDIDMRREELLAGTRPEIGGGRIILTGAEGFDGYEIMEYRGMVWGVSVRAKDMGQDCAMGCKQMSGGELGSYTKLGDESRQQAIDRMIGMAGRQRANGIINVEFELNGANQGASQVVVHGTAVVIRPVVNYVPTGAVGNILAEIEEHVEKAVKTR